MERRKARGISSDDDENQLALVKAAAWAWYQHGSGSDTRLLREYDVTSNKRDPKPSRYKLEAIRDVHAQQIGLSSSCSAIPIHLRADNSLLDNYEVERISRQLDRYIESSHAKYYGNCNGFVVKDQAKVVALTENGMKETKINQRNKRTRGFWLRHAVICGSSTTDVVGGTTRSGGSAKHVPVVNVAHCRPREP